MNAHECLSVYFYIYTTHDIYVYIICTYRTILLRIAHMPGNIYSIAPGHTLTHIKLERAAHGTNTHINYTFYR